MPIETLTLTDVGPFERLSCRFDGRMVGVTGPNGAGKSTVLRSVAFAVTGDTACLGRKDAVRIGRTASDSPSVILGLKTRTGTDALVARFLPVDKRPGRHRLVIGETTLSSAEDIATWFADEFGVTPVQAREVLFVEQGHMTDVITAPAARRAELFQKVFGLEAAARARTAAQAHLESLPGPIDKAGADAARDALRAAEDRLASAESELLSVPEVDPDELEGARNAFGRVGRASALLRLRDRLEAERASLRAVLAAPEPPEPGDRNALDRLLAAAERYESWTRADRAAADRVRTASSRLEEIALRERPDPVKLPSPSDRLVELRGARSVLTAVVSAAHACDSKCPMCAGPFSPSRSDADGARAELDELDRLERQYLDELGASYLHVSHLVGWQTEFDTARTDLAGAERELEAVRSAEPNNPGTDPAAVRDAIAELTVRREVRARDRAARAKAEAELKARTIDLTAVEAEIAEIGQVGDERDVRNRLDELEAAAGRRREAAARVEVLREAVDTARTLFTRIESSAFAADVVGPHRRTVVEVLSLLHRDAAPAAAAASALIRLTGAVNERLGQVSADYRVSIDGDGEIVCSFADGSPDRRASLLSPGQQTALALSWRVAVVDAYCPHAGVLCLDEPTNGLDAMRIDALRSALASWRTSGAGPQFVVVTHDRRLFGSFDHNIQL